VLQSLLILLGCLVLLLKSPSLLQIRSLRNLSLRLWPRIVWSNLQEVVVLLLLHSFNSLCLVLEGAKYKVQVSARATLKPRDY
jgi:hypothetical protein